MSTVTTDGFPTITYSGEAADTWLDLVNDMGRGRYVVRLTMTNGGGEVDVVVLRAGSAESDGIAGMWVRDYDESAGIPVGEERFVRSDEFLDLHVY